MLLALEPIYYQNILRGVSTAQALFIADSAGCTSPPRTSQGRGKWTIDYAGTARAIVDSYFWSWKMTSRTSVSLLCCYIKHRGPTEEKDPGHPPDLGGVSDTAQEVPRQGYFWTPLTEKVTEDICTWVPPACWCCHPHSQAHLLTQGKPSMSAKRGCRADPTAKGGTRPPLRGTWSDVPGPAPVKEQVPNISHVTLLPPRLDKLIHLLLPWLAKLSLSSLILC